MPNFIDTFPLPAIIVDKDFMVLSVNKLSLNLFGKEFNDINKKNITSIFPLLVTEELISEKNFETLYSNSDGEKYNLSIQFSKYINEEAYGIFYITKLPTDKIKTNYSIKKTNLLNQKLHIFDSFLNQINEGVLVFNEFGQLMYLNKNGQEHFQLKNKKIKNYYIWQIFDYFGTKDDWEKKKKVLKIVSEEKFIYLKKDLLVDSQFTLSVIVNHRVIDGNDFYVVTYKDVSEAIRSENIITEKNNHLNLFHKNIPAAIYEFIINEKESYFSYISNAFGKIFGFEINVNDIKWNAGIKLHPDDFQTFIETIKKAKVDISEFKFTGRLLLDDKTMWFETNASITYTDDKIIFNGIVLNITERKEIELENLSKRKFNDSVLLNIPADIAVFDKDHNYLFINSKGIANEELRNWMIGKNDFDYCAFKGIDTSLAKIRREYFNQAKDTKQQVDWIDEIKRPDKSVYLYRRFSPFYVENRFVYMIGYGIDVTELKETQHQLERQNKNLLDKNQELERFTHVASHDLQEPLLSLISYSKLLDDEYSDVLDDEGKLFVQFINKSATRMRTLISGLMEYTRINRKENIVLSDLNLLLKDVQEDLTDRINNYNAIISIKELPTINCYPTFVRILFQNLISNAIKFTHKDSTPIINISCKERNSDWLFLIEDNGIGINFKDVEEIFLIFKRLHNEKTYSGSGIGLAHCKKIVEIHNGEIWVESVVGKGSIFNFTISKNI